MSLLFTCSRVLAFVFLLSNLAVVDAKRGGFIKRRKPKPGNRICCLAMTAQCLACAANQSVEDYCSENPTTAGCNRCPNKKKAQCGGLDFTGETCCPDKTSCFAKDDSYSECRKKCPKKKKTENGERWACNNDNRFCCKAMTAKCLACAAGQSVEEYCLENPETVGCEKKACCKAMTAECLSCAANQSVEDYCSDNPTTAGCGGNRLCCLAMTAQCLACAANQSVENYCLDNPFTLGCEHKVCCKAMTAECLACAANQSVEEYCSENPTTAGCGGNRFCCKAMTAQCLACAANQSVEDYCLENPITAGCGRPKGPGLFESTGLKGR